MTYYPVSSDMRILRHQRSADRSQLLVLDIFIGRIVRTFQFDADSKIIAALSTLETGLAGMPRAFVKGGELQQAAIPPNQQVRRYLKPGDFPEIRMHSRIKPSKKQVFNERSTEFARRQGNSMYYQQADIGRVRPCILMRALALRHAVQAVANDLWLFHSRSFRPQVLEGKSLRCFREPRRQSTVAKAAACDRQSKYGHLPLA